MENGIEDRNQTLKHQNSCNENGNNLIKIEKKMCVMACVNAKSLND